MTEFLRERYQDAKAIYLDNLAYMNRQNDEFAEKKGGVETLNDADKRIYEGRQNRIIRLVAFHDRTQEYIESLEEWIADLIQTNRQLAMQRDHAADGWIRFFPNMTNNHNSESDKEHKRQLSIIAAEMYLEKVANHTINNA